MARPAEEKIAEAREIFGDDAVYLALEMVSMSDPDGAYTHLEDMGQFEASEALAFMYFWNCDNCLIAREGPGVWPGLFHFFCANKFSKFVPSNNHIMYTLNCSYYDREFQTIDELLNDIMISGMDPNYEILHNGRPTGEQAIDLIQF